ncbi:hypothetical protein HB364_10465 [Pseudoflavitalea sp. X16]|uniref:hypothetical protein n=1 Tax=Paraflavitalea devenefica TaxID=2716334 RepID=UPI00142181A4|nr:hypothetical protein [Paraflavitalea devenefica]NII25507.1 hypothetical protein [Paraflavitalea devenefica]
MVLLHLEFTGNGQPCSADVELEGIADSWDAHAKISGHPHIHELHVKCWLGSFLKPVFASREEAMFFEPLLEAIDEQAKQQLPPEFTG